MLLVDNPLSDFGHRARHNDRQQEPCNWSQHITYALHVSCFNFVSRRAFIKPEDVPFLVTIKAWTLPLWTAFCFCLCQGREKENNRFYGKPPACNEWRNVHRTIKYLFLFRAIRSYRPTSFYDFETTAWLRAPTATLILFFHIIPVSLVNRSRYYYMPLLNALRSHCV